MKPTQLKQALIHLTDKKRPAFIWGPPGVGKSDIVREVAEHRKVELRDVRLSLMDPTDLKGLPVISGAGAKKQVSWAAPDFLPTKGKGILFLDELVSAPQSVQAASYQLILNRKIGDYELPEGWSVLAAGNRAGDRAVVHAMPSALANRFVHIDFDVDPDDWSIWAVQNGVSDLTRGFIRFRPDLLHKFDAATNPRAFPTPRSWVFCDDVIQSGLSTDTELELIRGTVGEGAAIEYVAHIRMAKDLPSVDEILMNPDSAPVPTSPASKYAICTALDKKANKGTIGRLLSYVGRLDAEYQVVFMRAAGAINREILQTKEGIKWLTDNQEILI